MENKPVAAAVLTEEELQAFVDIDMAQQAHQAQMREMVRELQNNLSDKRAELAKRQIAQWDLVAKKYNLDPLKTYGIIHGTREVIEDLRPMATVEVVPLNELMRRMQQNAAAPAEAAAPPTVPGSTQKH